MSDFTDEFEDFEDLLQLEVPLPEEIANANSFNAVQFYWFDTDEIEFVGPEDFVAYLKRNFTQIDSETDAVPGDVWAVWSRTSDEIALGKIRIVDMRKETKGYPFGLVAEHAFVVLDGEIVFQKRDTSAMGPYELVEKLEALAPYEKKRGFEVTIHRRKD